MTTTRKKPTTLAASGFAAVDALEHDRLLGASFQPAESWHAWSVFLRALDGLPITAPEDLALFRKCTGRLHPPTAPAKSALVLAGRRSGKSRLGSLLAVTTAAFIDWRHRLAPGESAVIVCLASDKNQARVDHDYVRGLVEASALIRGHLVGDKSDVLRFDTGAAVEVHAADFKVLRGRSYALVLADEACFWESAESSNPDVEVFRAVKPGLATLDGRLVVLSSPYAQRGAAFWMFRKNWGRDESTTLVWKADSRTMNPSLSAELIADAMAEDPEAARAEWLAEWRSDLSDLFTPEALAACTAEGRTELPPSQRYRHVGAIDAAGGSGADSFGFAVAHQERERGRVVLDVVREWRPPFDPLQVVSEIAALAKRYGVKVITGDRWAGGFVVEAFARERIVVQHSEATTSDLFLEMVPLVNANMVELLDAPRLLHQLASLQRSVRCGGRDRVDHRPTGHDDLAASAAGACVMAAAGLRRGGLRPVAVTLEKPVVEVVPAPPQKIRARQF
jgi:hypothetical protein